ncbi:hypothetical protein V1514DRAFT_331899 [Lipomyces japonicus]|uniref:uncharacterized protein n=1 Tax=Lipomyces japonicus TaxID=56871 RepID=UPI0034CE65E5
MKFSALSAAGVALLAAVSSVSAFAVDGNAVEKRGLSGNHVHHRHHARNAKADRRSTVDLEKRAVDIVYTYVTVVVDADGNILTSANNPYSTTTAPAAVAATSTPAAVVEAATSTFAAAAVSETVSPSSEYVAPTTASVEVAAVTTSIEAVPTTSSVGTTISTVVTSSSSSSAAAQTSVSSVSSSVSSSSDTLGLYVNPTEAFQDGTISCSSFPSGQGVVALDWLNLGGWSGIQLSVDANAGQGTSCSEGNLCSYACQAGMSKTQWPSSQPADGESRGGLICQGGYLYRTNTDTDYLCEWGVESAQVVSELSDGVAICRTDYPGTENMVIPTYVEGGATEPLTVVNEETYYQWEGKLTSAQYYVNNAGVSVADGCLWGSEGSGVGNFAPINFGAGYDSGIAYLSLIPNPNNGGSTLNFNVKIVASDDAVVNGDCSYVDGVYSGGSNGCTVAVTSGIANFVLYN